MKVQTEHRFGRAAPNRAARLNRQCLALVGGALLAGVLATSPTPSSADAEDRPALRADLTDRPLTGPARSQSARSMIASANPVASAAGREMIRRGGSAVDAAVATQLVLTLVEPGETGIGGGGFLMVHDAETGDNTIYDGRETAPGTAIPERFLWAGGRPMPFLWAAMSGRSVGTPGLIAMLHEAHQDHGVLPWEDLFEPAIALSRDGFPVSPRLSRQITLDPTLRMRTETRRYFHRFGTLPLRAGSNRTNPALADTLEQIAATGPEAFYEGAIASDITRAVRRRVIGGSGDVSLADLANYEAVEREPICRPYRDWTVCGMPLPSSGGVTILQMLGILEQFDVAALGPDDVRATHLFAEASRLAFADRSAFLGDTDVARAAVPALLDRDYLAARADEIDITQAMTRAEPGEPDGLPDPDSLTPLPVDTGSTSHLSVVDDEGNAVSLTSSIEQPFGSRIMVRGFILNNQLTDFAFVPNRDGMAVPNVVEPGKRPLSAMSPTLVYDAEGDLRYVVGSPGGSRIIGYVAKTLVGVLDWDMDIEAAASLGNVIHRGGRLELERRTPVAAHARDLRRMGHGVSVRGLTSGIHAIEITDDGVTGAADARRGGGAMGD